ncbi:Shedu anti-phage system protein SduA domain-containing protein [Rhizobium leguminosarum]|uniref:Shedu anti-phage system protein SduA domain-containing protein n=1 Tax=Rhizobium leguminosarum TaxID=384 RepID=UPI001C938B95|nr:Shedu anti-phage system protein SduA domain-containing protein [Rhizobium leguminosarum]MBY5415372.1 DUF4263 domain-containing protein [Rhizobium leguminosarum]
MYLEYDQPLVDEFRTLLDSKPPKGKQFEQLIQDFLEEHTELIPTQSLVSPRLHMNMIISKFALDKSTITDYVYIVRNSAEWEITFVELERPNKAIFTENPKRPTLHSEFNNARDQLGEWKAFVDTHRDQVIESLAPLMRPDMYPKNPVFFRYQLIIGRSAGKNHSTERKAYFAQIQKNSDMQFLTYDNLIARYEANARLRRHVVKESKRRFSFKVLQPSPEHIFSVLLSDVIELTKTQEQQLIAEGYDIPAWKAGSYLVLNNKHVAPTADEIREGTLQALASGFRRPRSARQSQED